MVPLCFDILWFFTILRRCNVKFHMEETLKMMPQHKYFIDKFELITITGYLQIIFWNKTLGFTKSLQGKEGLTILDCVESVKIWQILRAQFSSVAQSCQILCDPMDYSKPDFPVHYQLPELTQAHVHQVGDASQPSHPLSSPSPSAFNLAQHQGLFKRISSLHQVAKGLEFQLHQSFQWTPRTDLL